MALKSLNHPTPDFARLVLEESPSLIDELQSVHNRLALVVAADIDPLVRRFTATCIGLLVPPFALPGMKAMLVRHSQAKAELMNALRASRGLRPLPVPDAERGMEQLLGLADESIARFESELRPRDVAGDTEQ